MRSFLVGTLLIASGAACSDAHKQTAAEEPAPTRQSAKPPSEVPPISEEFAALHCAAATNDGEPPGATEPGPALAAIYDHVQVVIVAGEQRQVWARRGRPCSSATENGPCLASYRKVLAELSAPVRPCSDTHGCPSSACAVTTLGDKARSWCSAQELRELIGSVDDVSEAFLIAHSQSGAALPVCGLPEMSAQRKVSRGYELRERRYTKTCRPIELTELIYLVASNASSSVASRMAVRTDAVGCQSEDADAVKKSASTTGPKRATPR